MNWLRALLVLCVVFSTNAYAAIGDLVATLSVSGQSNVVFTITNNPGGFFSIQNGNQVVEAVNTPAGNYSIGIQAAAIGSSITQQFTLHYSPPAPACVAPTGYQCLTDAIGIYLTGADGDFLLGVIVSSTQSDPFIILF